MINVKILTSGVRNEKRIGSERSVWPRTLNMESRYPDWLASLLSRSAIALIMGGSNPLVK